MSVEKRPATIEAATLPTDEEPPPLLGTWRNLYGVLLAELVLLVMLFAALTRWAS